MTEPEKAPLYTAKAHTNGGRDGGASRTDDERSAIFLSVIKLAAGKKKVRLPADLAIDVDLGCEASGPAARLNTCRVSSAKLPRNWSMRQNS